jgi:excinuclease ABC subunit C
MREALTRRFQRYVNTTENPTPTAPGKPDRDETWRILPDLLLIDGGKGQLNVAVEVLTAFNLLERVPVASLAKRQEELFLPNKSESVLLRRDSPALYLVQRVRDEAHRFAITSHRQQRNKLGMASKLETIPGIGPKKRKALLKAFDNSIDAIRQASIEELMEIGGINLQLAETLKELL